MQMGARERANYLRHLVAGRQAGEADILEEDEATLAGSNVAALRSWVRTVIPVLCPCVPLPSRQLTSEQDQKRCKHPTILCSHCMSWHTTTESCRCGISPAQRCWELHICLRRAIQHSWAQIMTDPMLKSAPG